MVAHPEYEACSAYTHEGDGCWKPAVAQRWLDDQPLCWIHLAQVLVDHLDEIKAWRRTHTQATAKLRVMPAVKRGRR